MVTRGRPRKFDRSEVIERAMMVFWRRGYEATSMPDLVAAMGINSPSIYAAFGDKASVFREAVERYQQVQGARLWGRLADSKTARHGIETVLLTTADAFTERSHPPGCLVVLGALSEGIEPELRAELRRKRQASFDLMHLRLERAIEEGELAKGTDAVAMANFFNTVQMGMSLQARDGASRKTLHAIALSAMSSWPGCRER